MAKKTVKPNASGTNIPPAQPLCLCGTRGCAAESQHRSQLRTARSTKYKLFRSPLA